MKIPSALSTLARRAFAPLVAFALLATTARATWSVVVVNRATGEVCIASATCIANFDLKRWLPVVVVGRGAGAAQSAVDATGQNRLKIFNGLNAMYPPDRIFDHLELSPSHQGRQYGIASFDGPPLTFSGNNVGAAKFGVVGEIGDLSYAIQGNVLTGEVVVTEAEQALLNTPGDLGQKVMAAMHAAKLMGGDGRCSCSQSCPTCCGAPPPNFTHSAYTAFIVVARMGDVDGVCNTGVGCASGTYYLSRKFQGNSSHMDVIDELQVRYDNWRLTKIGVADHVLTKIEKSAQKLVADGQSTVDVTFRLVDVDGTPHSTGGQTVTLTHDAGPVAAIAGPVTDNGDGTHTVTLTATATPGRAFWKVVVQDGQDSVQLHPGLSIETDPVTQLHSGFYDVHAADGANVPLTLNSPADVGRPYLILGSFSGTTPGTQFGNITVPLNDDRLYQLTLNHPGPPFFPGSQGVLDGGGRAEAVLPLSMPALLPYIGQRFEFAAVLMGSPDEVTNVVGFEVIP